jgi:glucosyl-3-phosphoglycerate synthase
VITFAVIGHDEAELLPNAIAQATEAAGRADPVWFVDSASTDGSADVAGALGVEVLRAPLGKGRAMAVALARCETSHICFVDADIESSSSNIPLSLREALAEEDADMIVADFDWPARGFKHSLISIYRPLVGALFPEAQGRFGSLPFSGFRVLRSDLPLGSLPRGFGVETHLNLVCTVEGVRTRVIHVGAYDGPVRRKPELGAEVGQAILDVAQANGRLDPRRRSDWDAWLEQTVGVLRTQPYPGEPNVDYIKRFIAVTARALPAAA